MKFTYMGFSQVKLVEYGLDLIDAAILRYFIDFKESGKMVQEMYKNNLFYWVNYEKILKDNPIFNIKSKDTLRRRFKKLTDAQILTHYHKKSGGSYSFYGIDQNYEKLISTHTTKKADSTIQNKNTSDLKVERPMTKKSEPYDLKVVTKDNSIKDSSTKNTNLLKHTSINKEEIKDIMCVLDKKVTFEEAQKIFKIANGNINLIKEKYEVAKASSYKNLVGFLIKAIEDNWNMPKFQNKHNSQVKTKFHNFESRTSDYTAEELENIVLKNHNVKRS